MKIISLFFVAIPLFSFSQTPPKGTNEIIVKGIGFATAVKVLLDSGYQIRVSDEDLKTAETLPHGDYGLIIFLHAKDSTVFVYGKYYAGQFAIDVEQAYSPRYTGSDWLKHNKRIVRTFDQLDAIARAMKGELSYEKIKPAKRR